MLATARPSCSFTTATTSQRWSSHTHTVTRTDKHRHRRKISLSLQKLRWSQWRRNWGFRRFNEPGPELLGTPESGAKKFYARKEYATSEKLASRNHKVRKRNVVIFLLSALWASSFSPWGPAEGIEGPQVTVEPGPLRALLRH